jgi:hypothetical protein
VRVIMGEAEGTKAPIEPWTPMSVLHVSCGPGARWEYPLPASQSLTLYVRRGPLDVVMGAGRAVRLKTYETAFCNVGTWLIGWMDRWMPMSSFTPFTSTIQNMIDHTARGGPAGGAVPFGGRGRAQRGG